MTDESVAKLRELDADYLLELIKSAKTGSTDAINQTRVTSVVGLLLGMDQLRETLQQALNDHAKALAKGAKAAEKHASRLAVATWMLAVVTVLLFVAQAVHLYLEFQGV